MRTAALITLALATIPVVACGSSRELVTTEYTTHTVERVAPTALPGTPWARGGEDTTTLTFTDGRYLTLGREARVYRDAGAVVVEDGPSSPGIARYPLSDLLHVERSGVVTTTSRVETTRSGGGGVVAGVLIGVAVAGATALAIAAASSDFTGLRSDGRGGWLKL